jgi:hypothetical protein
MPILIKLRACSSSRSIPCARIGGKAAGVMRTPSLI